MNFSLDIAESSDLLLTKKKCAILPTVCCGWYFPQRYLICLLLGMALASHLLIVLSTKIAINGHLEELPASKLKAQTKCPPPKVGKSFYRFRVVLSNVSKLNHTFTGTEAKLITAAVNIGYVIGQVPSIIVAQKYGGKLLLIGSIGLIGAIQILIPYIIEQGGAALGFTFRLLQGIVMSPMYNLTLHLLVKWAPMTERATLTNFTFGGVIFGHVIGSFIGIEVIDYFANMRAMYYFFGSFCFLWVFMFSIACNTEPNESPYITSKELKLIQSGYGPFANEDVSYKKIPFKKIIKCRYVWLLVIGYTLQMCETQITLDFLVNYLIDEEHLDNYTGMAVVAANALFVVIYLTVSGRIIDYLVNHNKISLKNSRRYPICISIIFPFLSIVPCIQFPCHLDICMGIILAKPIFSGFTSMLKVNIMDVTPNFVGPVFALIHTATLTGYALMGAVTPHRLTLFEMRIIVYVFNAAAFVVAVLFFIFCQVEQLTFDKLEEKKRRRRAYPARY